MGRLVKFFAITYGVTWTCFISVAVMPIPAPYRGLLMLLGAFAPSLVALSLTARDEGDTGVRALLRRVVQWRGAARGAPFSPRPTAHLKTPRARTPPAAHPARPRFCAPRSHYTTRAAILSC